MDTTQYTTLFLQEMRENCAALNLVLVKLEKDPANDKLLAEAMRAFHSCKGAASTMGFEQTAEFCHALESVLDSARKGTLPLTATAIDDCLFAVDTIESCLKSIEKEGKELQQYPVLTFDGAVGNRATVTNRSENTVIEESSEELPHIRVESRKLDTLLELTGELSTLRLQFLALRQKGASLDALPALIERLSGISSELAYRVSDSRLIPLEQVFQRFPRLVRDLAKSQSKQVEFIMSGTGIELDKTLVDRLLTPLIHLLKNAVDHGIETPDVRRKNGKAEQGTVTLNVQRDQGYVIISVEDDGQVINIEDLKKTAATRGFSKAEVDAITMDNVLDLLSSSRFSSTTTATMVSGRGVGLSAVRAIMKSIGGDFRLEQKDGHKVFTLLMPLQLSVMRTILVRAGGNTYAFPFIHIDRIVTVTQDDLHTSLQQRTMIIDGESAVIVDLDRMLRGASDSHSWPLDAMQSSMRVLIAKHGNQPVGIRVDEVLQSEEIMVKPVPDAMHELEHFSGYSILGDGRIALIIDIANLLSSTTHPQETSDSSLPIPKKSSS